MKLTIAPIIKSETGDSNDNNNYRPIALVTAMSKIFVFCILIYYYNNFNIPVYSCFWMHQMIILDKIIH